MIKSMTGYGKGQSSGEGVGLSVEIRSVNHRYADITVKVPRSLMALEGEVRKRVGERLKRGKIDVFVNQDVSSAAIVLPVLNRPLADAYISVFEEMQKAYTLLEGIPVSLLVGQKDVILLKEGEAPEAETGRCLEEALGRALEALEGMRIAEGEATRKDFESRLGIIEELLSRVEARAPQIPLEWKTKLTERLNKLGQDFAFDPQRVAQEIAIFADRCDISEELTRIRSHMEQFRLLFEATDPVGRQMDFLVQELNREVNTMGSKSNDAELTRTVVALKAELEKVREQVQNIE